jgi:hypothetical protein
VKIRPDATSIPHKNPNPVNEMMDAEFPKEGKWQSQVEKWFNRMHWLTYHTWNSQKSTPGFPDLVGILPKVCIFWAELKTERGELSDDQEKWLLAAAQTGEPTYLWRPSDRDEIQEVITTCHDEAFNRGLT